MQCLLYSDGVKGGPRKYREGDEDEAVTKRPIKELEFIYSFYFILFFSRPFLPTTFTHTHTHDPRPLPTTHDPRDLATLIGLLPSLKRDEFCA